MNLWLTDPFPYPDKPLQRGKVLDAADLERLGQFERYKDVDGDGVCYRTIPGTEHPLAAYFTRGTGHNEKSGYSERPEDWKKNLDRLARKLETARGKLPAPVIDGTHGARVGLIAYGSTHPAMVEARDLLRERGDRDRILPAPGPARLRRGRCTSSSGTSGSTSSSRTATARSPRSSRRGSPASLADRLLSVTHYNGTPIAAENIVRPILGWEKNPSGPGWPTGDVEVDNPDVPATRRLSAE